MKIGFTGTMSVGKTTLVNALKELPEFKDYNFKTERSKYLRDLGIPLNTDSTTKGQIIFLAERCSELYDKNIITDRTVIDVMAFTALAKTIPFTFSLKFNDLCHDLLQEYDYIFYISPDGIDIEDNGVRTTDPEYRKSVNKEIKKIIKEKKGYIKNLIELNGSVEERVNKVKQTLSL
jgi:deoxyadenosine/deoxycytidine kinase